MDESIVIVMGINGAGKSTITKRYTDKGYTNINRDARGGSLSDMADLAEKYIKMGVEQLVLDNTYPTVNLRESIIRVAKKHDIPIECHWLTTSLEEAQVNVCRRMIKKHGKLLMPEEFSEVKDPGVFSPAAQFSYRKNFEKPTLDEGFYAINQEAFQRKWEPEYKNKAIIVDYDGTLRDSTGEQNWPEKIEDVQAFPQCKDVLQDYENDGYMLLGVSNQAGAAKGRISIQTIVDCFEETNRQIGHAIEYKFCPHKVPPVRCYCRKPQAGLGIAFIEKYKLNPSDCIMVGDQTTDKTFAQRCGFQFEYVEKFFGL